MCGLKQQEAVRLRRVTHVTPCVGVWIETSVLDNWVHGGESHPAWVCGLKLLSTNPIVLNWEVTPCVGVWIETQACTPFSPPGRSHTLRGCVD